MCLCLLHLQAIGEVQTEQEDTKLERKRGIETSWETERRGQQRGSEGGSDGCGEANSATFSIFAWHCHPCQLLNASVSQTSVQLASAPPLQACRCSDSIALITGYQNTYLADMYTQSHKYMHTGMHTQSHSDIRYSVTKLIVEAACFFWT